MVVAEEQNSLGTIHATSSVEDWFTSVQERDLELTSLTAARHGCVYAAVNIIAGDIGLVPLPVKRRLAAGGYEPAPRHWLTRLLTKRPNNYQTPAAFKEWIVATSIIWGNALVLIERSGGRPSQLLPLAPQFCDYAVDDDGRPFYLYHPPEQSRMRIDPRDVLHFRGLTKDSFWGWRLLEVAKHEIGLSRQLTQHADHFFRNNAMPGGVLQHPGKLSPEARSALRRDWETAHSGPSNSGRTVVLWEGTTWNTLSVSNTDAQLLELLENDPVLIGRLFRIPPHKLGDFRHNSTRANLEESNLDYYSQTLARPINGIREEINWKLLDETDYEIVPDPSALLRGDMMTQVQVAQMGVASMVMTRNEARHLLGLNPVPGGDEFENPNTTANEPAPEDPEDEQEQRAAPGQPTRKGEKVLWRQCVKAAEIEQNRVMTAARQQRQFVKWAEQFYGDGLGEILADTVGPAHELLASLRDVRPLAAALGEYRAAAFDELLRLAKVDAKRLPSTIDKEWDAAAMAARLFRHLTGSDHEND